MTDPNAEPETRLSSIEVGLLTVAERRGCVRTPRRVDQRNDPANIERLTVLQRLVERGLVTPHPTPDDSEELQFDMTDAGRLALKAADAAPVQPDR